MIEVFVGVLASRLLQLSWVFALVLALELAFPREKHSLISRLRGATCWLIASPAAIAVAMIFGDAWSRLGVRPLLSLADLLPGPLAYVIGPVLAALIGDFFFYWSHRAQHRFFWRFHAVHHSLREMNAVASYHHWTEEVFRWLTLVVPMGLLVDVKTGPGLPLVVVFPLVHGIYFHAPTRLHFGPLGRLVIDNRFHRIHHSMEPQHFDRNFGGFTPLWDVLFRTAYFPQPREWPATGLADQCEPETVGEYLVRPFRPPGASAT